MATDERWVFGHALHVENRQVGTFERSTLYSRLTLREGQSNWLLAAVPAPNVTEGWLISAVKVRYTLAGGEGGAGQPGLIDAVGIRDGEAVVTSFENLTAGSVTGWQNLELSLGGAHYRFGLAVSIHANYPVPLGTTQVLPPVEYRVVGVGLAFTR
jgi:hypothetical protein